VAREIGKIEKSGVQILVMSGTHYMAKLPLYRGSPAVPRVSCCTAGLLLYGWAQQYRWTPAVLLDHSSTAGPQQYRWTPAAPLGSSSTAGLQLQRRAPAVSRGSSCIAGLQLYRGAPADLPYDRSRRTADTCLPEGTSHTPPCVHHRHAYLSAPSLR